MKLFNSGIPNENLLQIVRANVRQPDEVVGDLYAQTACNDVGGRALLEMMEEFKPDRILQSLVNEAGMPVDLAQKMTSEAETRLYKFQTSLLFWGFLNV